MQATIPLVRSGSHVIASSVSRIPHLEYHIVRKLHRTRKSNPIQSVPQRQQSRTRSSAVDLGFESRWPSTFHFTASSVMGHFCEARSHEQRFVLSFLAKCLLNPFDYHPSSIPTVIRTGFFVPLTYSGLVLFERRMSCATNQVQKVARGG